RARRDGRPAVGDLRCIRLRNFYLVIGHRERIRDDLRMHRPSALTDFRASDGDAHARLDEIEPRLRVEMTLAAPREARAVVEQRETDRLVRSLVLVAFA